MLCSPTIFFMSNQRDFIFGRVARGSIDPDNEGIEWISLRSINQRARVGRGARKNRRPTTEEQHERQSVATACVALSSVSPTPDLSYASFAGEGGPAGCFSLSLTHGRRVVIWRKSAHRSSRVFPLVCKSEYGTTTAWRTRPNSLRTWVIHLAFARELRRHWRSYLRC